MATPRRILAIDDSLTIRKLLEMALGRAGYALELAANGQEGLQRALRNPPELILLDYVLPDMKGLDVAAALWGEEKTARVPVVVMSAKSDDLRPLFRELPSVVEFVGKPFTPSEITFLVADILARIPAKGGPASGEVPSPPSGVTFSFAQKEALAKAMFTHMRDRFARIPEWLGGLGGNAPAPYFARKILTPELLDGLLSALVPALREALMPSPASGRGLADGPSSSSLTGQTSVLPLPHLLRELNSTGRTGLLRLDHESRRTFLYLRRGRIVLVSHDQPDEYLRQSTEDLSAVAPAEMEKARSEQAASGRPLFVTLAERGHFSADRLVPVLYQHGKRALLDAIEAGPGGFVWSDQGDLPAHAAVHGQPLYLEQIQLERLRAVDDWAQVELHVDSLELVFRRADGFMERLSGFELTDSERRVLTLVDERNRVRDIIERSGTTPFEVFHCLFRLSQVGLVRKREEGGAPRPVETSARPVAILDADAAGVREPLARLLAARGRPVRLVEIPTPDDLVPTCLRERPRLLILDVSSNLEAVAVARRVRSTLEISDTALVAVADQDLGRRAEELLAAGFDGVLVKPFLFSDVERLLAA
jgi:DNA-binding response OmpR family regulator